MSNSDAVTARIESQIELFRIAFTRGDNPTQVEVLGKLESYKAAASAADAAAIDERLWADRPNQQLLWPGLLASLREALGNRWRYELYRHHVPQSGGVLGEAFDVVLVAPSGNRFTGTDPDRNKAFQQAFRNAGIDQ